CLQTKNTINAMHVLHAIQDTCTSQILLAENYHTHLAHWPAHWRTCRDARGGTRRNSPKFSVAFVRRDPSSAGAHPLSILSPSSCYIVLCLCVAHCEVSECV